MQKRLLVLGVATIGGVVALAAQIIATPQQLGVYDNVQFIRSAPQTKSVCNKNSAAMQENTVRFINSATEQSQKVQ